MFIGTVVQRNDGGPVGGRQTDSFVLSVQQPDTSLGWIRDYSEGRPSEARIPFTGTVSGLRLEFPVDFTIGGCPLSLRADTTVGATADSFEGTQTKSNCEGRAEGTVIGNKRH
jgi:hypothetical protein